MLESKRRVPKDSSSILPLESQRALFFTVQAQQCNNVELQKRELAAT